METEILVDFCTDKENIHTDIDPEHCDHNGRQTAVCV